MEEEFAKKHHIHFVGIQVGKLRRYFSWQNFADVFRVPIGFFQALFALQKFRPQVVFAKGGYVSVPVGFAAAVLRIPLVLHESDATPGLATRLLRPFAKKVFLSTVVGTPVREEILHGEKKKGYEITGFSPHKPVVLIIGGSLGAASLNKLVWSALPQLLEFCQIIHLTGHGKMSVEINDKTRYIAFEYADKTLPHFYAIADLVVSRAGASVLSELIALRKPHILIPLGTHASRGDQWANAKFFKEKFGSSVLAEKNLTVNDFVTAIKNVIQKPEVNISEEEGRKVRESAHIIATFLATSQQARQKG